MPRLLTAVRVAALLITSSAFAQGTTPPAPTAKSAPTPPAPPSPMKLASERTQAALKLAPPGRPTDVKSVEDVVTALYDVISGPAGKARDWQRFRSLFYPGAQMASVQRPRPDGRPGVAPVTPEDYVTWGEGYFKEHGFFERETHRQVSGYGDLVNVLSAYEIRTSPEAAPLLRGVNNIQLVFDGQRWWVLHISWTDEKAAGAPVPTAFTRK
ncbi:nuclear transport factor 2 family protein [Myxococcus landrumensis]|uniref:Nuclear transport factor 2 family protein n=1 Tax=Myxococcus landrumensis TaxID=2813577 RepID=A0ABX7N0V4_9BACT|nr:nuclear transport factor 2 family protein [Myxococcus landrumus]QSQ11254.1 nuclear transport factor 2 family protein [Myxococcus landrumus]